MSANEKRKLASTDEMQEHVDDLVASGAIILGDGKRLKVGDDGLLQVIDPAQASTLMPYFDARLRLLNVTDYLECSAGPKSVGWCDALNKLQLLDNNAERNDQLDIRAWEICTAAHKKTVDDFAYMDLLENVFRRPDGYPGTGESEFTVNGHTVFEFPQRACGLLGIPSSGCYREEAWDGGLADQVLEKDLEAYRLIDRCFGLLVEFEKSGLAYCEYLKGPEVNMYLKLFRNLQPITALNTVMEHEDFLILERGAKTAKYVQASELARAPPAKPH